MTVLFCEISDPAKINNTIIRERATRCKQPFSIQYLAFLDNKEAGYISFDNKSKLGVGVIYDVYVLEKYRKKGIGSKLISLGEDLTRELGCSKVFVFPEPFNSSIKKNHLVELYEKRGYEFAEAGEMKKIL